MVRSLVKLEKSEHTCTAIGAGAKHVVDTISIEDERWVRDVVLPRSLRQRQTLLEHGEDRFGHGLRPPGLQGPALAEPQVMHQALVGVPALLPHRLKLILVAVY